MIFSSTAHFFMHQIILEPSIMCQVFLKTPRVKFLTRCSLCCRDSRSQNTDCLPESGLDVKPEFKLRYMHTGFGHPKGDFPAILSIQHFLTLFKFLSTKGFCPHMKCNKIYVKYLQIKLYLFAKCCDSVLFVRGTGKIIYPIPLALTGFHFSIPVALTSGNLL